VVIRMKNFLLFSCLLLSNSSSLILFMIMMMMIMMMIRLGDILSCPTWCLFLSFYSLVPLDHLI